jgi:hypothetical protein
MRHLIVAMVGAVVAFGTATARGSMVQIAMGPVSAPHLPSGQPGAGHSADCAPPYDQCPETRKKPRHWHPNSKHARPEHLRDY